MPLDIEELLEKSQTLRRQKRFEEALVYANHAIREDEFNEIAWYQVAINRENLGDIDHAIEAYQNTVDLDHGVIEAWIRLGNLLLRKGDYERAKDSFENAFIYEENERILKGILDTLSHIDDEDQIEYELTIFEKLESIRDLNTVEINRKGIIFYRKKEFHSAIKYWKMGSSISDHPNFGFNLGLAHNQECVSQDADSIDYWRLVLSRWPDYSPAKSQISAVLPRLLALADVARNQKEIILPSDDWYDIYLNPYQVILSSNNEDPSQFDNKKILQLKKRLLQEIELEDGYISWLPEKKLDKSQAISLCEELNDDKRKKWHLLVYNNKPLLNFLSKGSIEHFLVNRYYSEIETIESLHNDFDFKDWLGKYFCEQFNRCLANAIEAKNIIIIECMLDGRRWTHENLEDSCFKDAKKQLQILISPLKNLLAESKNRKITKQEFTTTINDGEIVSILNLLPVFFEEEQNEVVKSIRLIAINSFNIHADSELSRDIIESTKNFKFKSQSLNKKLEEDIKKIEELIKEEKKHEIKLTAGKINWIVNKSGVSKGNLHYPATEIKSVRWGIKFNSQNKKCEFIIEYKTNTTSKISFEWSCTLENFENQKNNFNKLVEATIHYIYPALLEDHIKRLNDEQTILFGPCRISRYGIHHPVKGWIFTSEKFTSWKDSIVDLDDGNIVIYDKNNPGKKTSFGIIDVENALILAMISNSKV